MNASAFNTKLPEGFYASGVNCGVRRYRPDLGIVYSDVPCVASGVFTLNTCAAAPVTYCRSLLPAADIKAIVTNSGQANAATGEQGVHDNLTMAEAVAATLNCATHQVLTASTGVIGQAMEIDKITQAIPKTIERAQTIANHFALAIMTTDLVPKSVYKDITLSSGVVRITGVAKGSGMIHPNMATMLGYFFTDAKLDIDTSNALLKEVCDMSFNMISVDGETSTNDCAFLLANATSGVTLATDNDAQQFKDALQEIAIFLAKSIARDGEGASKLIEVVVKGCDDLKSARKFARSLTMSPLIKTAVYGASPNWGRIIARLGAEGATSTELNQCDIHMQGVQLYKDGQPVIPDSAAINDRLREDTIIILVDLKQGESEACAWGCDLTEKYVKINAEYLS